MSTERIVTAAPAANQSAPLRLLAVSIVLACVAAAVAVIAATGAAATGAVGGGVSEQDLLGRSVLGRPIYAYRTGDPSAAVKAIVLGNIHGDEPAGITVANAIIHGKGIHGIDLWVIPTANTDGAASHTRGNAHGVDLNRNFPYLWARLTGYNYSGPQALSEPESRAMLAFLSKIKPRYLVSMHQPLNGVDTTDGGARDPAFRQRLARNLNLPQKAFTCSGVCQGTMTGWFTHYQTGAGITVEFPQIVSASYLTGQAAPGILNAMGARYDTPADHNPVGYMETPRATGSAVRITGWAFDPDNRGYSISVSLMSGSTTLATVPAIVYRPDVNTAYQLTNGHGYSFTLAATNGNHTYCAVFHNIGIGAGNPKVCRSIAVNGNPYGHLDSVRANTNGSATLTGWAADPDASGTSTNVIVTDNGNRLGSYPADQPRPDVSQVLHISGNHGFNITLAAPSQGQHTYCVSAVNLGSTLAAATVNLGCGTVRIGP